MIEDKRIVQRNVWAITSLIIGAISLLLSFFAPVPFVPLNYCAFPLGAVSIVMGFIVQQSAKRINDVIAIQQARWGIGLGCVSWMINICWYSIVFSTAIAILVASFIAILSGTSATPTP
ncbi:MAG: hypothetical protein AABZ78_10150 [Chloroflexota bacterium]